ncbi:GNAT family N-acetyltransferase [Candidatus Woesearchaeota archaeon]|nr:GNAT family N-acetyltransferase [Candidatus Woesearchaeota archaeon]
MASEDLSGLCNLFFYSTTTPDLRQEARIYLSRKLGHPDKGSNFELELGPMKYFFRVPVVSSVAAYFGTAYLRRQGYDALLLQLAQRIIGHTAFQVHNDNSLHVFSIEVDEGYRGHGLATLMAGEVLEEARSRRINRVRVGGGRNEATNRIHDDLSERAEELRIHPEGGNWINIIY